QTYFEAKGELNDSSKELASALKRLVSGDKSNIVQIGASAKDVAAIVPKIIEASRVAAATTSNEQLKKDILAASSGLATSTKTIVQNAKNVASDPKSQHAQIKLSESFKSVTQSMTKLLDSAKQGAVGEIMCDEATELVTKVI